MAGINSRIQIARILRFQSNRAEKQGNQEGTGEPGRPGQRRAQEEQVGKYQSSSVRPVFQPNFSISSFFVEIPITLFLDFQASTHHDVLNVDLLLLHQPITKSLNADSLLFPNASVVDAFGAELRSCCFFRNRHLIFSFFNGHCVSFFKKSPLSSVFGNVDPCFVGLVVAFDWISSIFKFLFEEFVNVIFPSFSKSPDRLLVLYLVLNSGFHSAAFLSHLSFGEVAILNGSPFHFLCVLFQHRIFALSIFSMASSVLLFMYSIQSSSSSIDVVSISSSASSSNETSLSTSL